MILADNHESIQWGTRSYNVSTELRWSSATDFPSELLNYVQTDATIPNIVDPTMLGFVRFVHT